MKVHIAKRNDTFESIAQQYGVSLQDLIGMNTHINYLAGLVPGLKIKLPDINRKDGLSFQEKLQTHFPKVDTQAVDIHSATADEVEHHAEPAHEPAAETTHHEEEAVPIPLKPVDTAVADGVKVDIPNPHINHTQGSDFSQVGEFHHPTATTQGAQNVAAHSKSFTSQGAQGFSNEAHQGFSGQGTQGFSSQHVANGFHDNPATNFGNFAKDESNWNTTNHEPVGVQSHEGGITVNQSPYQHPHLNPQQGAPTPNYQAPSPHHQSQVQTYPGTSHLGEPVMITHYPPGWQDPYNNASTYYDRPPMNNSYSTYIPGPATIIYHGYEPRGWEYRQEAPNYYPYPDLPEIPVIYPGGYGYPTRSASPSAMMAPPTPCSGGFSQADYLSFYYPDEAAYWAAFPWT